MNGHDPIKAQEAGLVARLLSYVFLLLASIALFISASGIKTSRFEKLGAGAFPKIIFGAMAIVSAIAIIDALRGSGRADAGRMDNDTYETAWR